LGLFAAQLFDPHDFICEYQGELLTDVQGESRGIQAELGGTSFIYALSSKEDIDAQFAGSLMKYANNSSGEMVNAIARIVYVKGRRHIALCANRTIEPDEEIIFDYGYSEEKKKSMTWLN
jgi:SET domain-containing protein